MAASDISLRILVVEDDEIAAEFLALKLAQLGCTVETAADGEAGLARLSEGRFDVLVTDWMMPRMDGIELVRRARARVDHYLHVLLLTAPGEERTMETALEVGADDFLYKPITPVQLQIAVATARRVLGLQRRLEDRNRELAETYNQLKADVEAAADMQRSLIPRDGVTGALRHAAFLQPSIDMGGDSFGVAKVAGGTFFFAIDVSGHGVPAALNSFAMHQRLMELATGGAGLEAIAATVNRELFSQPNDSYLTALMGLVREGGSMELLRAGHPPPLLIGHGGSCGKLEDGGLPLGMFDNVGFKPVEIAFGAGDRLVCYSDGVMESGMDEMGFHDFCRASAGSTIDKFVATVQSELATRRRGHAPDDDISVLAIERVSGGD